jgi:hypothetical protein
MAEALNGVNSEIVNWGDLPSAEFLLLYVFVVQQSGAGTANLKIRQITDYRTTGTSGGIANPATDHGGLTGLGDQGDHLWALTIDGSRPLTADWDAGAFTIKLDTIQATGAGGIAFLDDGGNYGLFLKDGGLVGVGTSASAAAVALDVRNLSGGTLIYVTTDAEESTGILFGSDRDNNEGGEKWCSIRTYYPLGQLWISASASQLDHLVISPGGKILINDSANAKMTMGLTIQQDANDDEILAFKSSDVGHPVTDEAEVDTYGAFKKVSSTRGGLQILGLTDSFTRALEFRAVAGATPDPVTTPVMRFVAVKTDGGTGTTALGSTESTFQFLNDAAISLHSYGTGNWTIGSLARNTKMTIGLTINQGGNDD